MVSDEQAYETLYPQAGWAEQRPADWWSCLNTAVANVTDKLSIGLRYSISAISVCATTRLPLSRWMKTARALTNAIMWMDNRAVKETASVNATHHPILDYCGGEDSVEWTIPKMLWIKNNQPEVYQRSYRSSSSLTISTISSAANLRTRSARRPVKPIMWQ